ncbi:MAG TPA: hypothetical protein VGH98_20730 [Gemmatimonadaceae bacterium]|jgi:hypothetical protein
MSANRTHWSALIWFLLPALAGMPQPIAAQTREMTIALVKALADSSATATIIREPGPTGRTLLLLPEGADATALATALASLHRSREIDGEALANRVVITLHGRRSPYSLSADEQHLAEEYVSRLRKQQDEQLAGVGPAKTLVVTMAHVHRSG